MAILSGRLKPADVLVERWIAVQFAVRGGRRPGCADCGEPVVFIAHCTVNARTAWSSGSVSGLGLPWWTEAHVRGSCWVGVRLWHQPLSFRHLDNSFQIY